MLVSAQEDTWSGEMSRRLFGGEPAWGRVRGPLFLFVFAEELSRSFMPLYVRELYAPQPGLDSGLAIGLPITVYMIAVALFSPWGGRLTDRFGARRVFLAGLVPSLAGFLASAFAAGLLDFTLARAVTAIGYAITTMACQGYLAAVTPAGKRSQGMNVFVGAVLAAAICGAALGGALADLLGFRGVFLASCALVVGSGLLVLLRLSDGGAGTEVPQVAVGQIARALANPRFAALVLFAAIPAKVALTGFLYYLAPLHLDAIGAGASTIGRLMMAYGVAVVVVGPVAARAADRFGWRLHMAAAAGVVSGLGMLGVMLAANEAAILGATSALGVAAGMGSAPMLAAVPDLCPDECRALGLTTMIAILRLLERVGSAAGPVIAGLLVPALGYGGAIAGIGALLIVSGAAFALAMPRMLSGCAREAA